MMFRYAKVALDGATESYAGHQMNRQIEMPATSIGALQNGAPVWRPIVVMGGDNPDEELFSRFGPDYEVEKDRVVERFRYEPVPGAVDILARRVAQKAGQARMRLTGTPALGAHREYAWLVSDANKAINLAEAEDRLLEESDFGKFPFLAAGIGITCADILEEAHRVKAEAEDIRRAFARIRRNRLILERDVSEILKDGATFASVKAAAALIENVDMTAA